MKRINKNILAVLPETLMGYLTFALMYSIFKNNFGGYEYLMIIPFIVFTVFVVRENAKQIRKLNVKG